MFNIEQRRYELSKNIGNTLLPGTPKKVFTAGFDAALLEFKPMINDLVEALNFYAKKEHRYNDRNVNGEWLEGNELLDDDGDAARAVLLKWELDK